jgi:MFS transporter, OFA family, oxalate/formate antiporter
VSGILAAGVGSGALIWAPIAAILIKDYGVLTTFKMLGTLYLVLLCALSLLIRTAPAGFAPAGWAPSGVAQQALSVPDKDWRGMLGDPLFYCLAAVIASGAIAGLMVVAHASPILQAVGNYSAIAAGSWVGILAVFNSGGRVGWGFISDRIGRMPSLICIYVILSLVLTWLASTPFAVVVPLLIVGSCFGGFMGMLASLTADAFGPKYLAMNFGLMFFPFGVGAFIGPRLAGVIKASTGGYSQAFQIAGVLSFAGIGLAILAKKLLERKRQAAQASESQLALNGSEQEAA